MSNHGQSGLRELRACLRDVNESLRHLNLSIAHFIHARKVQLDVDELKRIEVVLGTEVFDGLVRCIEQSIGREDRN